MLDRPILAAALAPALAALLTAALLLPACGSSRSDRQNQEQQEEPMAATPTDGSGPTVSIEPGQDRHVVVITAPTGGWSIQWEKRVVRDGTVEEYLTVRRPNPEFYHVQALTPHRINSNAPLTGPIKVFIRVVDHGQDAAGVPYKPAATAG